MFGMIIASGIRSLSKVQFDGTYNLMIVAISIGVSMIPLAVPTFYDHFPEWLKIVLHSGITFGSLMAVALNVLLNGYGNETHVAQATRREKAIARLDKWKAERKVRRNRSI